MQMAFLVLLVLVFAGNADAARESKRLTAVADGFPVVCLAKSEWPPELRNAAAFYDGRINLPAWRCTVLVRVARGWRPHADDADTFSIAWSIFNLGHELGHAHGYGRTEADHHEADCYAKRDFHRLGARLGVRGQYRRMLERRIGELPAAGDCAAQAVASSPPQVRATSGSSPAA